jgi:hypothetical protein
VSANSDAAQPAHPAVNGAADRVAAPSPKIETRSSASRDRLRDRAERTVEVPPSVNPSSVTVAVVAITEVLTSTCQAVDAWSRPRRRAVARSILGWSGSERRCQVAREARLTAESFANSRATAAATAIWWLVSISRRRVVIARTSQARFPERRVSAKVWR